MDLQKAKIFLDKINREFARMTKDPENVVRIDVDIMQSYVRDLYEACRAETPEPLVLSKPEPIRQTAPPKIIEFSPERPAPQLPPTKHNIVQEPPVEPPRHEPKHQPAPPPQPTWPTEVATPTLPPEMPKPVAKPLVHQPVMQMVEAPPVQPPKHEHHPSHAHSPGDADLLFEQKQARELSEKLAERPIEDLKKGIALNDRLLLTRELFGGDSQAFDASLTALNSFSGFEQAKEYLVSHCVEHYGWLHKNKVERAKEFVRLVRRRYKQ